MHEVGLAQELVRLAEEAARQHGASRVRRLGLRLGALSGVVEEALRFAFEAVSPGTLCEGAELAVEHVPLKSYCPHCQEAFLSEDRYGIALCPRCGEPSAEVLEGREFVLSYVEVI
ncbi:hydrogenase maturation nickel metallochaperone HypA [Thermus igniterrae]|jgi:hydrogenase nickel incorporation protein HypA/HybF|uniref:hydrogenase maturation nickel metallochaperone HypA n=1 Tax=Thermus igniterrae TaxID=88189 RepID=UPI00036DB78E|nr:hydrogenase maturation nickel metallochaperone HypA [Thermus igniterrae]